MRRQLHIKPDPTNLLFIAIIFLSLLTTLFIHPNHEAVIFGIKTNLVALIVFFIAQLPQSGVNWLKKYLSWIILVPGAIVAIIAILQSVILPVSLLETLGYGTSNIDPRQIVDGSLSFYRAFSTLGGPNQLGTYLIIPLVFSLVLAIKKRQYWLLLLFLLVSIGIVLSFSRSAWLGAVMAIYTALLLLLKNRDRVMVLSISAVFVLLGIVAVPVVLQNNPQLENILFHGRVFENRIEGSDQSRLDAISNTTSMIISRPFGHGLGSAGPASFRTTNPVIPENWYLQIAYEIGIVGLVLYILAFAGLMGDFIRNRQDWLASGLFAITCGVLVSNLFLHAWADSTLALVLFILYGLYKGQNR